MVKLKKKDRLKYVAGWVALGIAIASIFYTCSVDNRSDLRDRANEAFGDLERAIQTAEEYKHEGFILTETQHKALTSAANEKREARGYKNSEKYRDSIEAANNGINILENNFPADEFPDIYYPPQDGSWRDDL